VTVIRDWLDRFTQPIVPLLLICGFVLALAGGITSLSLATFGDTAINPAMAWPLFGLGVVCFAVGVLLSVVDQVRGPPAALPDDFKAPLGTRANRLYPTQAHILAQLRTALRSGGGSEQEWMRDDDVHALLRKHVPAVAHATAGELFYRLEHLRLLGFLASTQERGNAADTRRHRYRLTPAYREELEKGRRGRSEKRGAAAPGGDADR
jgi:hypothetical protein